MGYGKVFWIREESIRQHIAANGRDDAVTNEVGKRVLSVRQSGWSGYRCCPTDGFCTG